MLPTLHDVAKDLTLLAELYSDLEYALPMLESEDELFYYGGKTTDDEDGSESVAVWEITLDEVILLEQRAEQLREKICRELPLALKSPVIYASMCTGDATTPLPGGSMEWHSFEHAVKLGECRDEYAAVAIQDIQKHPRGQPISFCASGDTLVVAVKYDDGTYSLYHARTLESRLFSSEEANTLLEEFSLTVNEEHEEDEED